MNLADAIRQAALRQAEEQGPKENPMSSHLQPSEGHSTSGPADSHPDVFAHAAEPQYQPGTDSQPAPPTPEPGAEDDHHESWIDTGKLTITTDEKQVNELFASDSGTGEPVSMPENPMGISGGNAVRFEIFLSPEQLSCLFRALVSTQHSMMTLREAANYLRIPATTLEQLAVESKIPALQLEGRWRFPKSGIDEWVMLQSFREGEVSDAA
jgi:excisionase family DNA binding protein